MFEPHQTTNLAGRIFKMSPLAGQNWNFEKSSFCNFFILKVAHYMWNAALSCGVFGVASFINTFWSCWADSNCRPHPYQDWLVVVPLCSSPVFCCNSLSVFNALTIFRQISIVVCCSLLSAEKVLSSRFFSRFFKSLLFCVGWKPWGNDAARQPIYLEIASTIRALFQAPKSKSYLYLIGLFSPSLAFSPTKM